jgi:hypothetical protein
VTNKGSDHLRHVGASDGHCRHEGRVVKLELLVEALRKVYPMETTTRPTHVRQS